MSGTAVATRYCERVMITGTLQDACYAAAMINFLNAQTMRISSCSRQSLAATVLRRSGVRAVIGDGFVTDNPTDKFTLRLPCSHSPGSSFCC